MIDTVNSRRSFFFLPTCWSSHCGGKEAEGVWEHGVEENIWTEEERGNGGMEEIAYRGSKWFVLLTQYRAGDKIEKNEMGWACGAYGWGEGCV